MAFHEQSYNDRYKVMGDIAESVFEAWALVSGVDFARFGQSRPRLHRHKYMKGVIRHRPDYQCEWKKKGDVFIAQERAIDKNKNFFVTVYDDANFFVEVKGCKLKRPDDAYNEDMKIKDVDIEPLLAHTEHGRVYLFFYDDGYKAWTWDTLEHVIELAKAAPKRQFTSDKKWYNSLVREQFVWTPVPQEMQQKAKVIRDFHEEIRKREDEIYGKFDFN